MSTKRSLKTDPEMTFEEIAKSIDQEMAPVDLNSKIRVFDAQRGSRRELILGQAVIYDLNEKPLSRVEFKNLGINGVCCEVSPIDLDVQDELYIHFDNSINLGPVLCSVQWITKIDGHRKDHKLIGLRFKKMTAIKAKLLQEFLEKIQKGRKRDPFYVG